MKMQVFAQLKAAHDSSRSGSADPGERELSAPFMAALGDAMPSRIYWALAIVGAAINRWTILSGRDAYYCSNNTAVGALLLAKDPEYSHDDLKRAGRLDEAGVVSMIYSASIDELMALGERAEAYLAQKELQTTEV